LKFQPSKKFGAKEDKLGVSSLSDLLNGSGSLRSRCKIDSVGKKKEKGYSCVLSFADAGTLGR
jgi:hypothetical protein